jgi:hypothetical protein
MKQEEVRDIHQVNALDKVVDCLDGMLSLILHEGHYSGD